MKIKAKNMMDLVAEIAGKAAAERAQESARKATEEAEKEPARKYFADGGPSARSASQEDRHRKETMGHALRHILVAKGDVDRARMAAKAEGRNEVTKALGTVSLSSGGALVFPDFADEIIPRLDAASVLRSLGVTTLSMNSGSLVLPFESTGPSADYVAQGTDTNASEGSFGQMQLTAKDLVSIVPVSDSLIRFGGAKVADFLANSIARKMAAQEDLRFIRGTGVGSLPKGLLSWAPSANKFNQTATTISGVLADHSKAIRLVEEGNVLLDSGAWIMAPRTKWALAALVTADSVPAFRDEIMAGRFLGFPFKTTTNIPKNLGGGTESETYFFNAKDIIVAESDDLQFDAMPGQAYVNSSGTVVAAASRLETVLRASKQHDLGARYRGAEIAVVQAVTLGA